MAGNARHCPSQFTLPKVRERLALKFTVRTAKRKSQTEKLYIPQSLCTF